MCVSYVGLWWFNTGLRSGVSLGIPWQLSLTSHTRGWACLEQVKKSGRICPDQSLNDASATLTHRIVPSAASHLASVLTVSYAGAQTNVPMQTTFAHQVNQLPALHISDNSGWLLPSESVIWCMYLTIDSYKTVEHQHFGLVKTLTTVSSGSQASCLGLRVPPVPPSCLRRSLSSTPLVF